MWHASGFLLFFFTLGAAANAGRAMLMRLSGPLRDVSRCLQRGLIKRSGQRIVARLREQTYSASLRQEIEFVERGEGDVLRRLSVDTSIVGERLLPFLFLEWYFTIPFKTASLKTSQMVFEPL